MGGYGKVGLSMDPTSFQSKSKNLYLDSNGFEDSRFEDWDSTNIHTSDLPTTNLQDISQETQNKF